MQDYYKVLQYLRETHIDRQYPCTYDSLNGIESPCNIELSKRYVSDHENTFKLTGIVANDTLQIQLKKPRDYVSIETFEVLIYTTTVLTKNDVEVGFSNLQNGAINQINLTSTDIIDSESSIPQSGGGFYLFKYQVRKANTQMHKKNRKIGSVSCINLKFKQPINTCYLSNMVARETQFNITLEDLDELIEMGKMYVLNQLSLNDYEEIPSSLKHLCFKSAGAYAFLVQWEAEGKTMDDGTREGRNYATRLFDQVDAFIERFKEVNPKYNSNKVEDELIGYSTYREYPLHNKKPHMGTRWRIKR